MKIYYFGAEDAPVLLLLPGTCCHWKSNFQWQLVPGSSNSTGHLLPLEKQFR